MLKTIKKTNAPREGAVAKAKPKNFLVVVSEFLRCLGIRGSSFLENKVPQKKKKVG